MKTLVPFVLAVSLTSASGQTPGPAPLMVAPGVDLPRYMGTWHEVARLPFRFQSQCVSDVTATYTLQDDGTVLVVNRCRTKDGTTSEAKGIAKRARPEGPSTKLKVRFAPSWLSALPFVWGDYWILLLAPDYSYAVVGEPGRRYLWILSRTPSMDDVTYRSVLEQLKATGYDVSRLVSSQPPTAGEAPR
jgi:apolipoprotein D and lipocalin family protein